jgi:iron(III) transport system permease protein
MKREPAVTLLILGTFALVAAFVCYPLGLIFVESFRIEGEWGLANYGRLFGSAYFLRVMLDTLKVSLASTIGAVLVGLAFAYALVRAPVPGRRFFFWVSLLPIIAPPFVVAFSFILLFGRNGLMTRLTERLFGVSYIIYGWDGIVLAQIVAFFPLATLILSGTIANLNQSLEEAARDLGAREGRVFFTVTLPLLMPGLTAASLLVFMSSLASFGPPALLGGGVSTLAVEALTQTLGVLDWGMGTAIGVLLLIPSLLLFQVQGLLKKNRSYVTVTGAPTQTGAQRVPRVVAGGLLLFLSGVSLLVIAIFGVVFVGAVTRIWGVDYTFTLEHFRTVLAHAGRSVVNSVSLAAIGAVVAAMIGMAIGYVVERRRFLGRRLLDYLAMLPYAVPGTLTGLGLVLAFNSPPVILTGTAGIILLAYVTRRMPFGLRAGASTLQQIDPVLEDASADLGARWGQTFRWVLLPLLRPAFIAALAFTFIRAMTEINASIFLISPSWRLMAVEIYNSVMAGELGVAAAFSTMMIVLVALTLMLLYRVTGTAESLFKL